MHSSRMCTDRLLTISRSIPGGGLHLRGSASGGSASRGSAFGGYASRRGSASGGLANPPVDRQTPVKHYLATNFVCGR